MFDSVDPKQSFPTLERGILTYWREEDIFKRSIRHRSIKGADALAGPEGSATESSFSFFDGPPFATGLPHYGHLLAGTIKDVIPRYQTMRGKKVERRFGWDCHGLPIENLIEKEEGLKSRKDIEMMGIRRFNGLCRASVQRFVKEWRVAVERMGRWVDMDHDYRTMDPDYMESIWWVFKELYDKKLISEGHKSMHVCPHCETPLSNFEVTQGYKDIDDYALTAKFELVDEPGTFVLAWTTTGWTLPGNLFLAVKSDAVYVKLRANDVGYKPNNKDYPRKHEYIWVSKNFAEKKGFMEKFLHKERNEMHADYSCIEEKSGKHLIGLRYTPLFPYFAEEYGKKAFRVVDGSNFVTTEDGTGIVHIAPGYGEDDYALGVREEVSPVQHVGMDGKFIAAVIGFAGKDAKPKDNHMSGDKMIAAWLEKQGKLFTAETFKHSYPHCWRCDSPLINYATSSWFVSVEKIKESMMLANAETSWMPAHIRDGRFGKWLENARDWAISRNRYWGTPLPIWRTEDGGDIDVIGSRDDLMACCRIRFTKVTVLRHAESEGNITPVYQGKVPGTPLTRHGQSQAKDTAEALSNEEVCRIYASPLLRTEQTAKILSKETGATVTVDERLREVRFGEYEGKHVDFSDLTLVKARRAHKLETGQIESIYHFPGMETWSEVSARTGDFLREILPRHRGEHIVIVTHADPLLTIKHFFGKENPLKLCHQPYPAFAKPLMFYYDHDRGEAFDLHKDTVDDVSWPGSESAESVRATLVRHGETDWNKEKICQGQEGDRRLTELGEEQAHKLARSLKKRTFDVLVTSDLRRARRTAEILAEELTMKISEELPLLRERKFGAWVGRPLAEILKEHPIAIDSGEFGMHHETGARGETLSAFLARAREAVTHLRERYRGKRVLVVCHGGMIQAISAVERNLSYTEALAKAPVNCETLDTDLHPHLRRVPEVLDCWFESGAMPYAAAHFPFATRNEQTSKRATSMPPGFPADFIAEGIDQTRGWFYTLTVLSAVLFKKSAFRNCVVNGTVLAEDGKKMSKRLKNYPEPLEIVEKHGADAVRFALMSSPAVRGEDMRFSEKLVEETVRSVLLPLWNTYAFFVTYANAAGWEPTASRKHSAHPLDRWILAEVQDLVNRMTQELEAYDLSATCGEIHETIDALTNWYVRLSRRRFAGHGLRGQETEGVDTEQDQAAALGTLYDVLLTISQLLAPFCPFVTEAMTLNLVSEKHSSVHLTDWPAVRPLTESERELVLHTRSLRLAASIGQRIRSEQKIKVRQPLAKAVVAIPATLRGKTPFTASEVRLLQEELNVQSIVFTEDPGSLASPVAMVDARKVGPRLGARVQELIAAGKRGDFSVAKDASIRILDSLLAPDEVRIIYASKEGEGIASDRGIVLSLDIKITDILRLEGFARDLVREIQQLRKERGLSITDKIILELRGADDVLAAHRDLILQETNATLGSPEDAAHTIDLDGRAVDIRFKVQSHQRTS